MANQDPKSGFTFCPFGEVDDFSATIIESMFDQQADFDEIDIYYEIKENKNIKALALAKTILYPFEIVVFRIIAGKAYANKIKAMQSLYTKFLKKKITLKEFKEQLIKQSQGE